MIKNNIISTQSINVDVTVIGGGGAGLTSSVAAAEKGASVIVLEKRRILGGNSVMAEGFFAAESPVQKRMKIDADRDMFFKIAMDYAHWNIDPQIVRAFIDKSGDTVRWLEEKGLKLDWIPLMYPNQVPLCWHCLKKDGAEVIKALTHRSENLGVILSRQTAAKKILADDKGKVAIVLAKDNKNEVKIFTKSVIIATGGYGGNKTLLKKYNALYNENMHCLGLPLQGDGLLMAMDAGAACEGLGIIQFNGQYVPGSIYLRGVAQEPNTVWVNKKGIRFADETIAYYFPERANAINRQPDSITFSILDSEIKRNIIANGFIKGIRVVNSPPGVALPELENLLRSQDNKEFVKISNSWDEIADWMGVKPGILKNTIEEYNSYCNKGHDEVFAKDRRYLIPLCNPPYYAIKCLSGYLGTIGGIKINHHMEVLNSEGNPISGLYAAGSDTGGWESETYCLNLSGSTFGFAINSGRIAGENAAKYAMSD